MSPFNLNNKTILVIGASGGLGRAVAILLAEQGAHVIVHGRSHERCLSTLSLLSGSGHSMAICDLKNDDVTSWMQSLVGSGALLDGYVHAAGIQIARPLQILDDVTLLNTMETNVLSAVRLTRAFRSRRISNPGSSIVWISSVMGIVGQPSQAAYCASKGALISMCKSLALELCKDRIRINCVAPGLVDVGMAETLSEKLTGEQFQAISAMHPLGLGKAEQVAGPVAFLLSEAASWITGTTLIADGGYCAH